MNIQEVKLTGVPYLRGKQYGIAVKERVHKYLSEGFFRINWIRHTSLSESQASEHLDAYLDVLNERLSDQLLELEGFSAGAEITLHQAVALQYRRELIGVNAEASAARAEGDCTAFAVSKNGTFILGQTIDQDGLISDMGLVLRIMPANLSEPEILMYSFVGLLAYLGINSSGVGVCINLLTTNVVSPGVSPYLLVREILNCHSAEEAVGRIKDLPKSSARAFTIVDQHGVTCCEFSTNQFRSWRPRHDFYRANHFLNEDLLAEDRLNIFSKNGSIKRQKIIADGMQACEASVEASFKLFADHSLFPVGLCAHGEGDYRRPDTVAAALLYPGDGIMWVCQGHPCEAKPIRFNVGL